MDASPARHAAGRWAVPKRQFMIEAVFGHTKPNRGMGRFRRRGTSRYGLSGASSQRHTTSLSFTSTTWRSPPPDGRQPTERLATRCADSRPRPLSITRHPLNATQASEDTGGRAAAADEHQLRRTGLLSRFLPGRSKRQREIDRRSRRSSTAGVADTSARRLGSSAKARVRPDILDCMCLVFGPGGTVAFHAGRGILADDGAGAACLAV